MTTEQVTAVKSQETGAPDAKPAENIQQTQSKQPEAGSKEYNFRHMERQLQEQKLLVKELTDALKGKPPEVQQSEDESLPDLSPDDIPEWKDVKKSMKNVERRAEKIAEEKVKKILAEQDKARLPQQVRQKYQDFDQVVTAERIEKLEQENPALAQAFALAADPYSAAYSYLKVMYAPKIQDSQALEEAQKIAENAKKPMSSNVAGRQGALKNASAFAKKPKDQLYKEMMEAASRAI